MDRAHPHLAACVHGIDLLHVSRVAGPLKHPIDVELVRVLDEVVEIAETRFALFSHHCEYVVLRNMKGHQVLYVLSRRLVLEVAKAAASGDPRVPVIRPDDNLARGLLS
jgi:hypothetical protein